MKISLEFVDKKNTRKCMQANEGFVRFEAISRRMV